MAPLSMASRASTAGTKPSTSANPRAVPVAEVAWGVWPLTQSQVVGWGRASMQELTGGKGRGPPMMRLMALAATPSWENRSALEMPRFLLASGHGFRRDTEDSLCLKEILGEVVGDDQDIHVTIGVPISHGGAHRP